MNDIPVAPTLTFAKEELVRIVNTNPLLLTDTQLKILLSMGSDVVVVEGQLQPIPVSPGTAKWTAWKIEHDNRMMTRQITLTKYTIWAAAAAAVAALATAVITLVR